MVERAREGILRVPEADRHVVQLYRDEAFLEGGVAAWAGEALARGGAAVLIGTRPHLDRIAAHLSADEGLDPDALEKAGRLVLLDADATLRSFTVDGALDAAAFRQRVTRVVRDARAACEADAARAELRAWGEMVDLLRKRGDPAAAARLEAWWNDAIDAEDFRLLCSYEVDNLDPVTHARGTLRQVCAGHSHLVPEANVDRFERAVSAALVEHFGENEAGIVRLAYASQRSIPVQMPSAEAVLVALNDAQPEVASRVLASARAHLARDDGAS